MHAEVFEAAINNVRAANNNLIDARSRFEDAKKDLNEAWTVLLSYVSPFEVGELIKCTKGCSNKINLGYVHKIVQGTRYGEAYGLEICMQRKDGLKSEISMGAFNFNVIALEELNGKPPVDHKAITDVFRSIYHSR